MRTQSSTCKGSPCQSPRSHQTAARTERLLHKNMFVVSCFRRINKPVNASRSHRRESPGGHIRDLRTPSRRSASIAPAQAAIRGRGGQSQRERGPKHTAQHSGSRGRSIGGELRRHIFTSLSTMYLSSQSELMSAFRPYFSPFFEFLFAFERGFLEALPLEPPVVGMMRALTLERTSVTAKRMRIMMPCGPAGIGARLSLGPPQQSDGWT